MGKEWDQGRTHTVSGNKWKWTHNNLKLRVHSKRNPDREVHSDTSLPKKDVNISNKQPSPTPTRTQGTTTKTEQSK